MDNAERYALLFGLRGGSGLYIQCVEVRLMSLRAKYIRSKSRNLLAKRFLFKQLRYETIVGYMIHRNAGQAYASQPPLDELADVLGPFFQAKNNSLTERPHK